MFWKKKNPGTDILYYESNDPRESYRYYFKTGQGFQIEFKEKKVWLLNISAEGVAFGNQGFQEFDTDAIKFTLDIPNFNGNSTFSAKLKILKIDENDICHCVFEQCPLEQQEMIHKYVLEMQKDDLAH